MGVVVCSIALLVLALTAAVANAATPVSFGRSLSGPRVVVDAAGRGFFTWSDAEETSGRPTSAFHYCRVPQGAASCDATLKYNDGASRDDFGGFPFVAGGGRILLLEGRVGLDTYDLEKKVWTSTDDGKTFSGPASTGSVAGTFDSFPVIGDATYLPNVTGFASNDGILTVNSAAGVTVQLTGTAAATTTNQATLGGAGAAQAIESDGSTVVALWLVADENNYGSGFLRWSRFTGTDMNDAASWTPPQTLDTLDEYSPEAVKLAAGPSGLYVVYARRSGYDYAYVLRRFTGSGWGPPLRLSEVGDPGDADLVEDSSGILHFAWVETYGELRYRYARTAANTQFTGAQHLGDSPFNVVALGVNAAGRGWIAGLTPGYTAKALPIQPGEPPYTGPNKKTTTKFGSQTVTLASPKECVFRGRPFVAKVSGKGVRKVVYWIDGKRRTTLAKGPFRATLGTKGLGLGVRHLKATVTDRYRGTATDGFKVWHVMKTGTKSIAATFRIC